MKRYLLISVALVFVNILFAQDSDLYKTVIQELSSSKYYGRGYYKSGDAKAAKYIKKQFQKIGAKEYISYYQSFSFPVNVFHGNMSISVDGNKLEPAKDFVVRSFSQGLNGEYGLYYINPETYDFEHVSQELELEENKNSLIVVDFYFFHRNARELARYYKSKRPGFIFTWETPLKFYKSQSAFTIDVAEIWVTQDFPKNAKSIQINIDNKLIEDYTSSNVIAFIEGKHQADSFFVFTAHYDHLGMMGKDVYFPGANDNASGVSMLIALAEHYAKFENQPNNSMLFIATAGEETGLRGAFHYADNPYFPLSFIKYVINLDMIVDNSEDIYVEISEQGERGFELFEQINDKNSFFTKLDLGELEGNSDHFPFAEKAVPAIFFLMKGDAFKIYHTPEDNFENIYFENYPKLFKLIQEFVASY